MITITQTEVAKRVGVSQRAVAYALSDDAQAAKRLRPETRSRILKMAQAMGYVPHAAARSLKLGKARTIALISSLGLHYPHVHELIEQFRLELARHSYRLILEFAYQPADEKAAITELASGRCDGVLRFSFESWARPGLLALRQRGLPVVVLQPRPDPDFDTIDTDRREESRLATEHLLEQGHHTIAAVVGPEETGKWSDRVEGYRQTLQAAGAGGTAPLVLYVPAEGDVKALWEQLKSARPRPTAVFVYNDQLAVRLTHAIRLDGGRVPADMAVVAADNTWVWRLAEVPITSVDHNRAELARAAVALLLERMEHPEAPPRQILVKPTLVVRASSVTTIGPRGDLGVSNPTADNTKRIKK